MKRYKITLLIPYSQETVVATAQDAHNEATRLAAAHTANDARAAKLMHRAAELMAQLDRPLEEQRDARVFRARGAVDQLGLGPGVGLPDLLHVEGPQEHTLRIPEAQGGAGTHELRRRLRQVEHDHARFHAPHSGSYQGT